MLFQHFAIHFCMGLPNYFRTEIALHPLASGAAHIGAHLRDFAKGCRWPWSMLLRLSPGRSDPVMPCLHGVHCAGRIGRNHRHFARLRFQRDTRKSFAIRRQHKHIHQCVIRSSIGHKSRPQNCRRELDIPAYFTVLLDRHSSKSPTSSRRRSGRDALSSTKRFHQFADALVFDEASDEADHRFVSRQTQRLGAVARLVRLSNLWE